MTISELANAEQKRRHQMNPERYDPQSAVTGCAIIALAGAGILLTLAVLFTWILLAA